MRRPPNKHLNKNLTLYVPNMHVVHLSVWCECILMLASESPNHHTPFFVKIIQFNTVNYSDLYKLLIRNTP